MPSIFKQQNAGESKWLILTILVMCSIGFKAAVSFPDNPRSNDLVKLRSFWQCMGQAIAYPGKLLLSSDKLVNQRSILTTYEAYDLSNFFIMDFAIKFDIGNQESNQNIFFTISESNPSPNLTEFYTSDIPINPKFEGLVIYIKDFDTMHIGFFNSLDLTEQEILSRGKVCKLSKRNGNRLNIAISLVSGSLGVTYRDSRDGSNRICAQMTEISFPKPVFLSTSMSDDTGRILTVISKSF